MSSVCGTLRYSSCANLATGPSRVSNNNAINCSMLGKTQHLHDQCSVDYHKQILRFVMTFNTEKDLPRLFQNNSTFFRVEKHNTTMPNKLGEDEYMRMPTK